MATNRFDKPIESEYISQYTPIPFELLYAIGKANNERVDKSYLELGNQFSKWAEFRSPSAVDTLRWYDLTIGAGLDVVNLLASNPDLIKTAEGRSKIQSFINSRPYNELSLLQLSKQAMLQRLEMNQKLAASGKYNPLWHDVDLVNYDTRKGIFSDITPLAYKSEVELVEPYVNNLKSAFIDSKGGYDYTGVSTNRTDEQIAKNISAIYNTPEAQKHLEVLQRQGYSPEQASQLLTDRIYRAGREFAYENREENEFAKLRYAASLKQQNTSPAYLTDEIEYTGLKNYMANKDAILSRNPEYSKIKSDLSSSDPIVKSMAERRLSQIEKEGTPKYLFRDIMRNYATVRDNKMSITNDKLPFAINDILNRFSFSPLNAELNDLLLKTVPNTTAKELNTPLGNYKMIHGAESLDLMSRVVSDIAGFNPVNENRNKVNNALKSGKLNNMILLSNDRILTIPTKDKTLNILGIKVAISEDDIKNAGLTELDMKMAGATIIQQPETISRTSTENLTGRASNPTAKKYKGFTENTTRTSRGGKKFYTLDLSNELPKEMIGAAYVNQQALEMNITDKARTELYPDVQNQAYGF